LTLRQLLNTGWAFAVEGVGPEKADEIFLSEPDPATTRRPRLTASELEARRQLMAAFGKAG
jgi:hypothetical protein